VLTPDDAAAVLRRAVQLDTPTLAEHDALDEQVVRAAARDVGLSEASVEQAVAEWRAGVLAPLPPLAADTWAGLPGWVAVERAVPLSATDAAVRLEAWLRGQWFERRRTYGTESVWAPRGGILASARRAADLDGRLRLSGVGRLRVCTAPAEPAGMRPAPAELTGMRPAPAEPARMRPAPAEPGARVRLVADLGDARTGLLAGLVAAPALLTAVGVATALVVPAGGAMPEVLLALPAALGAGGLGWCGARTVLDRRRAALSEELERVLDELVSVRPRRPLQARATAWALERMPRPRR